MKLKKLFAGVVAVAMMATMAMPSFAVTNGLGAQGFEVDNDSTFAFDKVWTTNDASDNTIIVPNVALTMNVQNGGKPVSYPQGAAPASLVLQVNANDTSGNTTGFTVDLPNYSVPGKYTYILSEADPNVAGVKPNENLYQVTVWALQDETQTGGGNHVTKCNVKLSQVELVNDEYVAVTGKGKLSSVENTYQAGTVTVIKHVTGNMGNKSTKFSFKVVLESTKPVNSVVAGSKTFTFATTPNAEGKYTAEQTYELADSETQTITNLPFGVTYTVYEMNGNTAVEDQGTLVVAEDGAESKTYKVTYTSQSGALSEDTENHAIAASVENNCGAEIDTGVILDNAPYILMLAVVAGGAMMLVIKKRRAEEE